MLEETGKVISTASGRAKVALVRSEACGNCAAKSICQPTSDNTMVLEVDNSLGANPGDRVIISLPPKALLKATTLVYLLPAMAMVAGAGVGWSRTGSDIGALVGSLAGLSISAVYLFLYDRRAKTGQGPAISKVLNPGISHLKHTDPYTQGG